MKTKFSLLIIIVISSMMIFAGCGANKTTKGAGVGAAAGGAIGGVIGSKYGKTAVGVIMGAAVGGAAGAIIGNYMDKQAAEMEKNIDGVAVERVGEGIKLTFPSGILFGFDSSELQGAAKDNVQELAEILNKYPDTNVLIEGHTDSDGSEDYNQKLSERRASTVSNYLKQNGVVSSRVQTAGYGELQPIVANDTQGNKAKNRRVEVAVYANDELKEDAKDGKIDGN